MLFRKNFFKFFTFIFAFLFFASPVYSQFDQKPEDDNQEAQYLMNEGKQENIEGRVINIIEEKQIVLEGLEKSQLYQKLEVLITKGSLKDKKVVIENGNIPFGNIQKYKKGDYLVITYGKDFNGNDVFYITDYVRRSALLFLFMIFVFVSVLVGGWQGVRSLLGMGISFLVIFSFILPKIYSGSNPVQIAILGSLIIVPFNFILSHGVNRKTLIAILGTFISLVITGILSVLFVDLSKLTGFSSEEAGFLQAYKPGIINIKGLLLAGIIIGVLGVLDDITVSQSSVVEQLKSANAKLKPVEIYRKAMFVGKDHVSSMINTLILVYAGAALPLLLIFIDNPHPFSEIVNYEIIAEEIVRTLVGSIGLILAVPITTFLAVSFSKK
jgi:uncharacterized membrane protein